MERPNSLIERLDAHINIDIKACLSTKYIDAICLCLFSCLYIFNYLILKQP